MKKIGFLVGLMGLFMLSFQAQALDPLVLSGETIAVSSGVSSFTVPEGARAMLIGVSGGTIRFYIDGSTPASSNGMTLSSGDYMVLRGRDLCVKFKTTLDSGDTGVTVYGTFFTSP